MPQPSWQTIESTIQNVIASASGMTAVWSYQNYDAPTYPYTRISLGVLSTVGVDSTVEWVAPAWTPATAYAVGDRVLNDGGRTYTCTQAGTSGIAGGPTGTGTGIADGTCVWNYVAPGSEVNIAVLGVREVVLQLETFGAGVVEASGATARAALDQVVSTLRLPSVRAQLAAVGLTPFDPGAVQWIPDVVSTGFRGRASCDIRCYLPARAVAEYATWIASVAGNATVDGAAGGTLTVPIAAP